MALNGAYYGSRGSRSGQIFEVLAGLVINSSYQVEATTKIKLYPYLGLYPRNVFSAWIEVWSIPWPSTVPITAFWGRVGFRSITCIAHDSYRSDEIAAVVR